MLELYHAEPVANSLKTLLCCKEKGIDFVSHYVDLFRFEQHRPEFVALNPNGQVPVLVHDGAVITESSVINEYLDELFTDIPLIPGDPVQRAQMRIWNKYVDEYLLPAVSMIGWHNMVRRFARTIARGEMEAILSHIPLKEQRDKWATVAGDSFTEAQLDDSRRRIATALARAEQLLARSHWMAGPLYSLADISHLAALNSLPRLCPDLFNEQSTPRNHAWYRRMGERSAVQAALAMENRVPEGFRSFGEQ